MTEKLLALAAMEKILKHAGAKRVSEDAKIILKRNLEEYASKIAQQSIRNAKHLGRQTVQSEDIKLAIDNS